MAIGVCALTKAKGAFVKAHIVPEALSKPDRGRFWIESGTDQTPLRRWTSWYDNQIVTREGEEILARIDDVGIRILRQNQLVWSSFPSDNPTFDDWMPFGQAGHGIRIIDGIDGKALRLFLVSMLWRASASRRPEFRDIRISPFKQDLLRQIIIGEKPDRFALHPAVLTLISTRGERHNLAPGKEIKPIKMGRHVKKVPIFRFFFDGLVVHFHERASLDHGGLGGLAVGEYPKLGVITVPYERSSQYERLEYFKTIAETKWPKNFVQLVEANWRDP